MREPAPLVGLALLAVAATLSASVPAPARSSACGRFAVTDAHKLSRVQARRSIGCLLNRARRRHGVKRLRASGRLERAAQRHTDYMRRHRCFSHECPGEPSFLARLMRVDYLIGGLRRWKVGENIGWGAGRHGTPRAIVRAWMHSPAHRANILDRDYRQLGIGFAPGSPRGKRRSGGTFTTDFGLRRR
jgi:uncharacterized protein YkwD